jgi:hypothetical protein
VQDTILTQDLAAYLKATMNINAAANTAAVANQPPYLQGAQSVGLPTGLQVGGAMPMSLCNLLLLMTLAWCQCHAWPSTPLPLLLVMLDVLIAQLLCPN